MYSINEVDGTDPCTAYLLHHFNSLVPEWPALEPRHLHRGYWWLIQSDRTVGFAGLVPFEPFPGVGYLKRAFVLPEHRGNGLQILSMSVREAKAKKLGWKLLVSETANVQSAGNFIKAGYLPFEPEQKWGEEGSMYFVKTL